jgi:hypothetical protein
VPIQLGVKKTSLLHIHADILTKSSEFFKNAMKPEWRTNATKPIDMSDVELTVFEGYCKWLYTGKVVCYEKDDCSQYLALLYALGERLIDTAFQDVILAASIRRAHTSERYPGVQTIKTIYAGTPAGSPARRLMVDFWVFNAVPTSYGLEDLSQFTCPDFVNDLVRELIAIRGKPDGSVLVPWIANPGSYRVGNKESK